MADEAWAQRLPLQQLAAGVAGVLVPELATSFLLLVRFVEARTCSLLHLGCTYVYSGLIATCAPDDFSRRRSASQPLLGMSQSTAWIFLLWLTVYALMTLVCVLLETNRPDLRVGKDDMARAVLLGLGAAVLTVIVSVIAATEIDRLPAREELFAWPSSPIMPAREKVSTSCDQSLQLSAPSRPWSSVSEPIDLHDTARGDSSGPIEAPTMLSRLTSTL